MLGSSTKGGFNRIFDDLASGRVLDDPFPPAATERLRGVVRHAARGHEVKLDASERLQDQPIDVLLLGSALNWEVMKTYGVGVPLGVGVELPRTPAVFPPKPKWSLKEQET